MSAHRPLTVALVLLIASTPAAWAATDGVADVVQRIERERSAADTDGRLVQRLLDRTVHMLSDGEAPQVRQRIGALQDKITAEDNRAAQHRADAATLPDSACDGAGPGASVVSRALACLFGTSRSSKLADAATAEHAAAALRADLEQEKARFRVSLETVGVSLSPHQIDGLLVRSSAEEAVDLWTVIASLKQLNADFLHATSASGENAEVAKRYYGCLVILLEAGLHAHDQALAGIAAYRKRLDGIVAEAARARRETEQLRAQSAAESTILERNRGSLDLTLKAAGLYAQDLENQARAIRDARARVARQMVIAANTQRAVKLSSDLLQVMRQSGRAFEQVLSFELPDIRPFESQELKGEFEKLSRRLSSTPTS